ncbi:MAG: HPP family protein [Gallionella sp.]|nr:HPP family protein [Gallionella sp.]
MQIKNFMLSFKPHIAPVPAAEKIRSALAAGIAILLLGLTGKFLPQLNHPLLMLASMGAATFLLFVAPHSPMAQPWPLLGGNLVSAVAGWGCSQFIPDPVLAAGCAVSLAVYLMHYLRCLHPPGAATALIMVLSSAQFHAMGWQWAGYIVAANTGILLVLALLFNNIMGRRYPLPQAYPHHPVPQTTPPVAGLELADIEWAICQMDGVIDVSEEDLAEIYELAIQHALDRDTSHAQVR